MPLFCDWVEPFRSLAEPPSATVEASPFALTYRPRVCRPSWFCRHVPPARKVSQKGEEALHKLTAALLQAPHLPTADPTVTPPTHKHTTPPPTPQTTRPMLPNQHSATPCSPAATSVHPGCPPNSTVELKCSGDESCGSTRLGRLPALGAALTPSHMHTPHHI